MSDGMYTLAWATIAYPRTTAIARCARADAGHCGSLQSRILRLAPRRAPLDQVRLMSRAARR